MKTVRVCAVLGVALWAFAATWALGAISSGFVDWEYVGLYVFVLLIILGLSTNVILFRRSATLGRTALIGLTAVSLSLSALVASTIVYIATG